MGGENRKQFGICLAGSVYGYLEGIDVGDKVQLGAAVGCSRLTR